MDRAGFIELAGGVYRADRGYEHWTGADRFGNFWRFFFDEHKGWVKSVYGNVRVDKLYRKRRHSIEHIVPRDFLVVYLSEEGAPTRVIRGATANPLNFAAAERSVNEARSSHPFDLDGDDVKYPCRIPFNPKMWRRTGLDHEGEWVVPVRSHGDVARAILYMVLVYDIRELYNRHVEVLVRWCIEDPPTDWEIEYNRWVQRHLGINNPLIGKARDVREILEDPDLMGPLGKPHD
jgi:hypothetical protein